MMLVIFPPDVSTECILDVVSNRNGGNELEILLRVHCFDKIIVKYIAFKM